jgi:uncharacterized protein
MGAEPAIGPRDRSDEGRGRTALVTGASSGIGWAIADLLGAKGYRVIALARRRERLSELAEGMRARWGADVALMEEDLSDPSAAGRVLDELTERGEAIDVLVNNAGNSRFGRFDEISWEEHSERLHLMGLSSLQLCHGVLPGMVEQRWGRIVNVSSIGGVFTGFPGDITYGAVKGMLERFSEGVEAEFGSLGVHCTVVLPGPTVSEIFETPGSAADVARAAPLRRLKMSPESVARSSYDGVMSGRPLVVPGIQNRITVAMLLHAPLPVRRRLSRTLCRLMAD